MEIALQLKQHNSILANKNFDIVDVYTVTSNTATYQNAILECDLALHKELCEKKTLICGIDECKIFEEINLLQCVKCLDYGHISTNCKSKVACRKCAQEHLAKDCQESRNNCINCLRANEKGGTHRTNHRVSDGRCPVRKERFYALKEWLLNSKN